MVIRRRPLIALASLISIISGCSTTPPPLERATKDGGGVSVSTFKYIPAARDWDGVPPTYIPPPEDMTVKPYEIINTGIGNVFLKRDVEPLYRETIANELRLAGVDVERKGLSLGGEIQALFVEEHDKTIDWTLQATYVVKTDAGGIRFRMANVSQRQTAKEIDMDEAVKRLIEVNVRQILQDDGFRNAISNCCD